MAAGDHGVGQRQAARSRVAVPEQGRVAGRAAQQRPVRLGIGKKSGAAKRDDPLPVGLAPSIEVPLISSIAWTV
jgi:hypothetical protein